VRIAWFGPADLVTARLGLGVAAQWALWFGGVGAALAFAIGFHFAFDMPLQRIIQPWARRLGEKTTGRVDKAPLPA